MDPNAEGILEKYKIEMAYFGGRHTTMRQFNTEVAVMVERKRGRREIDA